MAHIHTNPNQHDMTVSAYIVLRGEGEDKLLVHMHRKFGKLLQIGGHIELNETPWQAVAHELTEECGYDVSELKVLQPSATIPAIDGAVVHPVPLLMNTHMIGDDHYHSDLCFAFVASELPKAKPVDGESEDLRWVTTDELKSLASAGEAVQDSTQIYEHILADIDDYSAIECTEFSLQKPGEGTLRFVA